MTSNPKHWEPAHELATIHILALNEGTGLSFYLQCLYHCSPAISIIIGSALGRKLDVNLLSR